MADSRFDNVKYVCWLKVCMALLFAKEGLEKLTDELAHTFHNELKKRLGANICDSCSKDDLKNQWSKYKWNCKANVCNIWLEEIRSYLPANKTSIEWDNSDISCLPTSSWECLKLFMPFGCEAITEAAKADIAAILTLYINNSFFLERMGGMVATDTLKKVKDIRNNIMHSCSLEIEETPMKDYIDAIIVMLQCHTQLAMDQTCADAITKINELKSAKLEVSLHKEYELRSLVARVKATERRVDQSQHDVCIVKDEIEDLKTTSRTEFQHKIDDVKTKYRELHKHTKEVEDEDRRQSLCNIVIDIDSLNMEIINANKPKMLTHQNQPTVKVEYMRNSFSKFIKASGIEGVGLGKLFEKATALINQNCDISKMKTDMMNLAEEVEQLRSRSDDHSREIEELKSNKRQKMMSYEERKKDLQCRLLKIYTKNCSNMPIYSLRPHLTRKLDDIYVKQTMVEKSLQGPTKPQPYNASRFEDQQENKKVQTLEDVFFKDSTLCKNIYVTGEAGVGKSTFCVHLVNLWLQVQSGTHDTDSSDLDTMKRFPLLFYINLRGVKLDSDSDIVNIIEQQWKLGSIDEFLENDQCLIIADGLDESVSGEPKRGIMNNSTILITTRPWKLEALRNFIEGDNIDKQVEIVSLDEGSAETLAEIVLPILAEESASKSVKSSKVFLSEMKDKSLEAFLKVPMLLIQMLCLWHDDISIGNSNYSIYENLVHHQIMLYIRSKNNTITKSSFDKNSPRLCKKSNCPCKNFSDIISKVGKLALKALVSENRENELVFDHSTTTLHGLCEQDVETCLRIGILSQHKLFGKITEQEKYISFVHKTYQEFFASLYLSYKVPISDIKSVLNTAICNLDRMLELEKLLMFVSGLNPEVGRKMADLLLKAADQDPRIQEYRQTAVWWWGSRHDELVSNIQTAILAAITECKQHQHQQQFRLDDVRVNKDMSSVLSCLPAGSQVTSIFMRGNYLPSDGVMRRINTSRLQKVNLLSCAISGDSLSQVVSSSLCVLYLDCVRMSHAALESLGSRLSAAVKLRRVWLGLLECETHGELREGRCAPLSLDFSSHVGLEGLDICGCEMSSCRMAPGMGKLEEVKLFVVTTTAAILKQIVDSLPGNNVKVELVEVTIRHEAGAASPAAILLDIRQSCRVKVDYVERRENGDLYVNYFVFCKSDGEEFV